jgi:CreA protein
VQQWSLLFFGRARNLTISTFIAACTFVPVAESADEPDLIFKRSTVFKWLTPNDKLATYGLDDPDGVACTVIQLASCAS